MQIDWHGDHALCAWIDGQQVAMLDITRHAHGVGVNMLFVKPPFRRRGIGGALLEELAYDAQAQPLAVTFMDYLLPAATEMPARLSVRILEETPTPLNPLGVKGAGEGGTAGAGAAIANAVADALRPFGAEVCDLPLTPARILAALRAAEAAGRRTTPVPEEGRPR
mgnify:CR=1 FL=1